MQVSRPEAHHPSSLHIYLLINIASIESLSGVLGEENEATPTEASVIFDEWGVVRGISRAERVDLMPGASSCR